MGGSSGPVGKAYSFDPAVKCCTYLPVLYNFFVGRILSDSDPAAAKGRATVEKRIDAGLGVTPIGLMQTPTYALLYGQSSKSFGRARALKCPHYLEDSGQCGVWKNRESTCATWFCKHARGNTGYAFWRSGLHSLLQTVEIELARWCLVELKVSTEMLSRAVESKSWKGEADVVSGDALDNAIDAASYAKTWCEWKGRERAFYMACAELVDGLSWADVLRVCGPEAQAYARLTAEAYRKLISDETPDQLKVGSFEMIHMDHGTTRLRTYSEFDPIDVPSAVMELLPYFDGRPTKDVLEAIAAERGIALDPALVRKMADFALLNTD
jgi:hypothetical protein